MSHTAEKSIEEVGFLVKPQLSFVRASVRGAVVGWGISVHVIIGCGQAAPAEQDQAGLFTIAEGSDGLGATLAAGGAVGDGILWAGNGPNVESEQRHLTYCTLPLDKSSLQASCETFCSGDSCPVPLSRPAHVGDPTGADHSSCFAMGVSPGGTGAIGLLCNDGRVELPLPPAGVAQQGPTWKLGIDGGVSPTLAVASPTTEAVWYYPPGTTQPIPLVPAIPTLPAGYGWDVAVLRLGVDRFNSRLIAVSAIEPGQVWLFRSGFPTPQYPLAAGCLGNRPGFGRVLGSGDLDGDKLTDLIVADDEFVTVFSGTALALVGEQKDLGCGFASLPEDAILASVSCASGGLTAGCEDAEFASSLAIADLDGDADGELIVGAPKMVVAGKQSGAVLVYDGEGDSPQELTEVVVARDLPDGARFGASIGVLEAKNIDYLAIGAPGAGSLHLASCFTTTRRELRPRHCPELDR